MSCAGSTAENRQVSGRDIVSFNKLKPRGCRCVEVLGP